MTTIEELQTELIKRQNQLIWANNKLFEAGKFAGEQDLQIDRLTEALQQIRQWAQAYPVEVFRPVSVDQLKIAAKALADAGIAMDALHGQWGRHILDGLSNIVDDALKEDRRHGQ